MKLKLKIFTVYQAYCFEIGDTKFCFDYENDDPLFEFYKLPKRFQELYKYQIQR